MSYQPDNWPAEPGWWLWGCLVLLGLQVGVSIGLAVAFAAG